MNIFSKKLPSIKTNVISCNTFLIILLLFSSCKKEVIPNPNPELPKEYNVINSGTVFDSQLDKYKGAYWINKVFHSLQSANNEETGAYGIGIKTNHIYVAGFYVEDNKMHPCYWDNGIQKKLTINKNSYDRGTALDIGWIGLKLYILGSIDLAPVIWVVNEQHILETISLPLLQNSINEELRSSSRFFIQEDKLYLGAAHFIDHQNGQQSYDVGYWSLTKEKNITYTSLQHNIPYARVWAIAANKNEVIISGESLNKNGLTSAKLWSSKGAFNPTDNLDPSKQRIGAITVDTKGNLHAMISNALFQPELAKMNLSNDTEFSLSKPSIPMGAKGNIKSIDFNEILTYSCSYTYQDRFFATYWLNEKQFDLEVAERYASYVNLTSIKITETRN